MTKLRFAALLCATTALMPVAALAQTDDQQAQQTQQMDQQNQAQGQIDQQALSGVEEQLKKADQALQDENMELAKESVGQAQELLQQAMEAMQGQQTMMQDQQTMMQDQQDTQPVVIDQSQPPASEQLETAETDATQPTAPEQPDTAETTAETDATQPPAPEQLETAETDATQPPADDAMQPVAVSELEGIEVVDEQGEQLGSVNRVVMDTTDEKIYVVMGHGGFLGLGEKEIALSPENLHLSEDLQLVVSGLTEEQITGMPEYEHDEERFRELEAEGTVELQTGPITN